MEKIISRKFMNYMEFVKSLGSSKVSPLYIISGEEDFLKAEAIKALKKWLGEDRIFFKEYRVDNQFNVKDLLSDLYSQALFDEFNLIILKGADSIATQLYDPLSQYLSRPPNASSLVIEMDKVDNRTKFGKLVKENGVQIECAHLHQDIPPWLKGKIKEPEVVQWLYTRASFYQKKISSDAAYMLAEFVGNSLSDLDLQLQKLALFVKDRAEIQLEDINSLVQGSKRVNMFEVLDAIWDCQTQKALKLVYLLFERGFLDQSGDAVYDPTHIALQFLRLFHLRMRQMWKLTVAKDSTGIAEFVKRKLYEQSRRFPPEKLKILWHELAEIETGLKTSRFTPEIAIESLVLATQDDRYSTAT